MGVATADPDATTVSLTDPFGVTVNDGPYFTYQTGNATEGIAYGHETIIFDSANFAPSVEQFFTSNLGSNPIADSGISADIIDKV